MPLVRRRTQMEMKIAEFVHRADGRFRPDDVEDLVRRMAVEHLVKSGMPRQLADLLVVKDQAAWGLFADRNGLEKARSTQPDGGRE
jgi:hypothetical protein